MSLKMKNNDSNKNRNDEQQAKYQTRAMQHEPEGVFQSEPAACSGSAPRWEQQGATGEGPHGDRQPHPHTGGACLHYYILLLSWQGSVSTFRCDSSVRLGWSCGTQSCTTTSWKAVLPKGLLMGGIILKSLHKKQEIHSCSNKNTHLNMNAQLECHVLMLLTLI